ncbi:MAG: 2Fe-2S iron-sulfur cluster-binding protein [Rubricoccaceae bacterium]|nr:2Fe-2S iron-sulfur cluster-binding protein [Rubricoccaceae bacterium]
MPQVIIDGKSHEFEKGDLLLQFCLDHGVEIPHFCYHPALSVPANCRQCLVKAGTPARDRATGDLVKDEHGNPVINYFPKPQTSCSLELSDGMVVHTQYGSEEVAEFQADNLELMLINHPLDCPICDQAGHCPLQIQAYKYGPEGSRFEFDKVHKPKRVQLGPNVVLDAERCINCTRCTRFTTEVSESHQLTIIGRGDKNYPMTAPGQEFDDPYSMNVCDICPVGALTEDYFRFKARVWEMSKTASISDFGGKGINVHFWVRDNQILRITPRENLAVNEYWMPDAARLVYERYNENRPQGPSIHGEDTDWNSAYDEAASLLKAAGDRVLFLGSAFATVEDNYLLMKVAETVGAGTPQYISYLEPGTGDGWLISEDKAPNTQGCERLGMNPVDAALLKAKLAEGEIDVMYVLEDDPIASGVLSADDLSGVKVILHHHHATNQTLPFADVALPAAMCVETIGTYVNETGRAQRLRPAKMIRSMNRSLMMEAGVGQSRPDRHGTPFDRWYNEGNQVDCQPGWESIPAIADRLGAPMYYKNPEAIMDEVSDSIPAFAGATYSAMNLLGVALEDIGEPA